MNNENITVNKKSIFLKYLLKLSPLIIGIFALYITYKTNQENNEYQYMIKKYELTFQEKTKAYNNFVSLFTDVNLDISTIIHNFNVEFMKKKYPYFSPYTYQKYTDSLISSVSKNTNNFSDVSLSLQTYLEPKDRFTLHNQTMKFKRSVTSLVEKFDNKLQVKMLNEAIIEENKLKNKNLPIINDTNEIPLFAKDYFDKYSIDTLEYYFKYELYDDLFVQKRK